MKNCCPFGTCQHSKPLPQNSKHKRYEKHNRQRFTPLKKEEKRRWDISKRTAPLLLHRKADLKNNSDYRSSVVGWRGPGRKLCSGSPLSAPSFPLFMGNAKFQTGKQRLQYFRLCDSLFRDRKIDVSPMFINTFPLKPHGRISDQL